MSAPRPIDSPSAPMQALLDRHAAWWDHRGLLYARVPHQDLADLWLPLSDGSVAETDLDLEPEMLDLERLAGPTSEPGPLQLYGDAIATRDPFVRVPWVEAILGCPIHATIQGGSMRARRIAQDWEGWHAHDPERGRGWLAALLQLTEMLAERSQGRYAVTQTLMRGPSDLAEAALGPEMTCLSMFDSPNELSEFLDEAADLFLQVLHAQIERIPRIAGGMVNPFGVWAPGTVVRTQCDASAFLSPRQYGQWFWPHNREICRAVDYALIHLHSGSLHVLDIILDDERPQAVQVSLDPEPSGPAVLDLIPQFHRILQRKSLIIDGSMKNSEVDALLEQLPHDGLYILVRELTLQPARDYNAPVTF